MISNNLARQAERHLERHGDYDELHFEGEWYSSGMQAEAASRFATGLIGIGLRPGDRVVVLMANCAEVLITYTALWRAGAVATPLIFMVTQDELRRALTDSGAVGVITTNEFLPKVTAALEGAPETRFVVVAGEGNAVPVAPVPVFSFAEIASAELGSIVSSSVEDLAALLYTGGTTGRSKGVPLTHANLLWCGSAAQRASAGEGLNSTLLALPLAHGYGLLVACANMHQTEPPQTILMRRFESSPWLNLAQRHRVQRSSLVPSMLQMLLAEPLELADLSALTAVASGGAPLPADVRQEFEARVPSATIYEGYGCTEAAAIISISPIGKSRDGSVGLPVPGCEVAIIGKDRRPLSAHQSGEICVQSPGIMSGYWRAKEETSVTLLDDWLHTGDIGHLDEDGYLYVVGRIKDLIIRGGFNIYPRDVEDVLAIHSAVATVGVVGRPDRRLGEEVVAFVSLRPGAIVGTDDLIKYAKNHLAINKYPREIRIVHELPLTSVGKVDKKRLREMAQEPARGG